MDDRIDEPMTTNVGVAVGSLALSTVGLGSAWYAFRHVTPSLTMLLWGGYVAALLVIFTVVIVAFVCSSPASRHKRRWTWSAWGEALSWATWIALQGIIWLLMPWGTPAMQLVTLLFSTGSMAAIFVTSLDKPRMARIRVVTMALSLVLVTLVHQIELWPYIAAYLLCFGIVMVIVSGIVARSIEALRQGRAEAEAARDARTQFMAAASHDLGQPLQAARLFFEQTVAVTDPVRRGLAERNTRAALGAMERLIHQMLDHLRLGEGVVEARIEAFQVGPLIARVAEQFVPLAELSAIRITALSSSLQACGDPALAERAFGNLLDNALRHSRATRVLVGVRRRGRLVRLYVIDDGRGIAAGEETRLFDAFVQGHEDRQPRTGLGIGLSSVRGLMALMHGATGLDHRWRHGAAFFLELPAFGDRHGA